METRAFNSISVDTYKGILTKTSKNILKLKDEINYYLKIPSNIIDFFPKLIDYSGDFTSYSIEYIPYKSLSELILGNKICFAEAKDIFAKLFNVLDEIHATKLVKPDLTLINKNFLIQKTIDRIALLQNNKLFAQLTTNTLTINGKKYKNFAYYQEQFSLHLREFFEQHPLTTVIHGDFSFSNILYCPLNKAIKLVDPRGSFGSEGIYGHPYYDYAKLMHCINGGYDYIVGGNFNLTEKSAANYNFRVDTSPLLKELYLHFKKLLLQRQLNVEILHLIESSLFLSMAALHYEDIKRQKALFLNGLILMNSFFEQHSENMH